MRLGVTLIELLAALVLLAVIVVSAGEWLTAAAATAQIAQARISWVAAANRVLDAIACDLATGDFDPAQGTPRVTGHDDLVVRTRVVIGESFSGERRWLRRGAQLHAEWTPRENVSRASVPVLDDVTEWRWELSQDRRTLSVEIRGPQGQRAGRSFSTR